MMKNYFFVLGFIVSSLFLFSCVEQIGYVEDEDDMDNDSIVDGTNRKLLSTSYVIDNTTNWKDSIVYLSNGGIHKLAVTPNNEAPELYQFVYSGDKVSKIYKKGNLSNSLDLSALVLLEIGSEENLWCTMSYDGDHLIEILSSPHTININGTFYTNIEKTNFYYTDDKITSINYSVNINNQGFETNSLFNLVYTEDNVTQITQLWQDSNGNLNNENVSHFTYDSGANTFNNLFENYSIFYFPEMLHRSFINNRVDVIANCLSENNILSWQVDDNTPEFYYLTYENDYLVTWVPYGNSQHINYTYQD